LHQTASHRKAVKQTQGLPFAVPVARDGTVSVQAGSDRSRLDLAQMHFSDGLAEGGEDYSLGLKPKS
jgi:hypothetical protein